MNNNTCNQDLLLLMLSLAQLDSPAEITTHFINVMEKLFAPARFEFNKDDATEPVGGFQMQTPRRNYGWVVIRGNYSLTGQQQDTLRNAVQMLAVIIEHNEQIQLSADGRKQVSRLEGDQTGQILQSNEELRKANEQLQAEVIRHRQTADELRETEEMFTAFMEHNPAYVFFKDDKLRSLRLSRNYEQMLGRPLSELIGKAMDELFPVELAGPMIAADRKILEEGKPNAIEEELNGRFYSTVKFPISITGKPDHLAGFTIDITRLKVVEKALRDSENILAQAQQIAHVGSWVLDLEARQLTWSEETYRIFGVKPCSFTPSYSAFLELIHPEDRAAIDEIYSASIRESRDTYEIEHRIIRKENGEIRHVQEKCRHERNKAGVIIRSVGMIQDITEQKQTETILAAEKERLAVTLRSIGDGVITTDTQGNIVMMNRVAEDLTGWFQLEAQGRPLKEVFRIVNEVTHEPCESPAVKVIASGGTIELSNHTVLIARNGTERIIADSGAPIKDANNMIIGVVLVFRDMTEKQKLLDALQRTDKLEAIGVLAGGIAHDFNNLLSGIFGYIELAHMEKDTAKTKAYLDQAMVVFERAKSLTKQLLAFAKGGAPLRKTGDLRQLVKESALFALSGSAITCDFKLAENLWPADFDRGQIEQVIDNLVINAQQAMPVGGRITITAQNVTLREGDSPLLKAGNYIKLSFADTGIGIPSDHLKRIFDPFFTTKQKGTGLGLATCYAIIQKHTGAIDVESVMGKGSTFHIFIPASKVVQVAGETVLPATHQGHGRILIMDDEVFVRDIVSRLLESMGYSVVEASDGKEAVNILSDAEGAGIDAAIFDLTVPGGMGGKEAIIHVRKLFPDLPVFASSGYSEDPVIAQPKNFGFTDSLRKPYLIDELAAMLNRHAKKQSSG